MKKLADKFDLDITKLSDNQLKNKLMNDINILARFLNKIPAT